MTTGDEQKHVEFSGPGRRQFRLLGWGMRLVGMALSLAGGLAFILGVNRMRSITSPLGNPEPFWLRLLIVGSTVAIGGAALLGGRALRRRGRRHSVWVLRTMAEAKYVPYVLYLRPFASDAIGSSMPTAFSRFHRAGMSLINVSSRTVEESICAVFRRVGRVIAVGEPEEFLPLPGADRLYLPWNGWRPVVASLIEDARCVLLAAGTSEGTLWEFRQLLRRRGPQSVLLLLYSDEAEYDDFRAHADTIFAEEALALGALQQPGWEPPALPHYPPIRYPLEVKWLPVPRGYIRFDADWTPHLTRLDPTVVRAWGGDRRRKKMNRAQAVPLIGRMFEEMQAAEDAADLAEIRHCLTIRELEAEVRAKKAGTSGEVAAGEVRDAVSVPVWLTGTGRFRALGDGGIARCDRTSARAHSGGRRAFPVDLPLLWLEEQLRCERERGAGDSSTLQLDRGPGGKPRGVVAVPQGSTGLELSEGQAEESQKAGNNED